MADLLVRPISASRRQALRRVLVNPTPKTWDDAYCIILRSEPGLRLTLWQAVKAVSPEFPGTKAAGAGGFESVPDQLTLARALRYAREAVPLLRS
jgi:hypothetical protein